MTAKSVFRLSTQQTPKYKDQLLNASFPQQRSIMTHEDSIFMNLDAPVVRNSPHFLWQSLTPELRAEALRRAHLIHLLRQVNPNLQLCRKSTGHIQISTAEKGIQVPDIRYDLAGNRRFSTRQPDLKRSASFTAPGVRIQPRLQQPPHPPPPPHLSGHPPPPLQTHPTQHQGRQPTNTKTSLIPILTKHMPLKSNIDLNTSRSNQNRPVYQPKDTTIEVTLKTISKASKDELQSKENQTQENLDPDKKSEDNKEDLEKPLTTHDEESSVVVVDADNDDKSLDKTERQVVLKSKDASSGDEDSVVVVLNQPRSEQGLERKYGQFFCRRCLRGWSSRSVWCVRHTCKVYIKQTCNICNKLVNPYLVCRVPPANTTTRKDRK
uniref:uncharacterized protein LOC120327713 n=1 Tax=Styela clava TaxID=7725 RepID=UPI00193A5004|nr:uncharacterized protein LOC120327713 [Styela clava]